MAGLLSIDPAFRNWSQTRLDRALGAVFASTGYQLCKATGQVTLTGPRQDHLHIDPELQPVLQAAGIELHSATGGFHISQGAVDFCLEDGLSGWFLSRAIFDSAPEDWGVLHLDDHADMMPTLLATDPKGGLSDPETARPFSVQSAQDWQHALARGTVTIGSYFTPLFHQMPDGRQFHIRHLRPRPDAGMARDQVLQVCAGSKAYPILGNRRFAALDLTCGGLSSGDAPPAGTYLQSDCIARALTALPAGQLAVHIDLDFFVNDFNGNQGAKPKSLSPRARAWVLARIDGLFQALADLGRPVARWIIATSPGFCAARHWSWLLCALSKGIAGLSGGDAPDLLEALFHTRAPEGV